MSTQLSPVETTVAPFAGGPDGSWIDRLQELVGRSMVEHLAESGITSLLEHPEHEWPVIRADRNHGQASTHLRTGFLTFVIDER